MLQGVHRAGESHRQIPQRRPQVTILVAAALFMENLGQHRHRDGAPADDAILRRNGLHAYCGRRHFRGYVALDRKACHATACALRQHLLNGQLGDKEEAFQVGRDQTAKIWAA
jgi:hypothetical protein